MEGSGQSRFVAGYTSRDVTQILGLTAAQLRTYIHEGCILPRRGSRGEYRFSLQDLVLLRTAKALSANIPPRRIRRALRRLREQLPSGRPLTGIQISAVGDDVVVREGSRLWQAESGQGVFSFLVSDLAARVAPLTKKAAQVARGADRSPTVEEWYELGCDLELGAPDQARDAYRRVLELDPHHAGARVNLGRLLHEAGRPEAAELHYRLALTAHSGDPIAAFNLGVALEDMGRAHEAIRAYELALASDPRSADAHYNLSRLYERLGKKPIAFRHLKAYRDLTRQR